MANTTMTSKGQVTIPPEIRDYLKLETGSKIDFVIDEKGEVKIIPLNVSVETLSGILHRQGMKAATLEEMDVAIQEGTIASQLGCSTTVTFDRKLKDERGFDCL